MILSELKTQLDYMYEHFNTYDGMQAKNIPIVIKVRDNERQILGASWNGKAIILIPEIELDESVTIVPLDTSPEIEKENISNSNANEIELEMWKKKCDELSNSSSDFKILEKENKKLKLANDRLKNQLEILKSTPKK